VAYTSAQLSVTTSATKLLWQTVPNYPVGGLGTSQYLAHQEGDELPIAVRNTDASNPVYLGGSGVTSSTGFLLKAGESMTFNVVGDDSLYAIATGATVTVSILVGRQVG
jgi:hypothetical protein